MSEEPMSRCSVAYPRKVHHTRGPLPACESFRHILFIFSLKRTRQLGPDDEEMKKVHEKYLASVQARISSSANNLLATAAPLESSGPTSSAKAKKEDATTNEPKKAPEPKEKPVQKAMLAVALLSIGALRPALAILTRFPWLVDSHREVADLLLRVLKTSIAPLYEAKFRKEHNMSFLQPRARYGSGGIMTTPTRKPQLTLCAPAPPCTHTVEFVFFYPHWAEWIPLCSAPDDLMDVIEPLMQFIGLHISREPLFLTKILRLGRGHLADSVADSVSSLSSLTCNIFLTGGSRLASRTRLRLKIRKILCRSSGCVSVESTSCQQYR